MHVCRHIVVVVVTDTVVCTSSKVTSLLLMETCICRLYAVTFDCLRESYCFIGAILTFNVSALWSLLSLLPPILVNDIIPLYIICRHCCVSFFFCFYTSIYHVFRSVKCPITGMTLSISVFISSYFPHAGWFAGTACLDLHNGTITMLPIAWQCVPLEGKRFNHGGYKCECLQGFEYPFNDLTWYFDGQTMEEEYRKLAAGEENR